MLLRRRLSNCLILFGTMLVLSGLVTGCATSRSDRDDEVDRTCVLVREIRDFDVIDDRHVLLEARRQQEFYLLRLEPPCNGLRFAGAIGVAQRTTRVCGDGTDWLTFDDVALGEIRCRILGLRRVVNEEAARRLASGLESK